MDWTLQKVRTSEEKVSYRLQGKGEASIHRAVPYVIGNLLQGFRVGILVQGTQETEPFERIWSDGRILKRERECAFVAVEKSLASLPAALFWKDSNTWFRFLGFDEHTPEDVIFRSLLEEKNRALLEIRWNRCFDGALEISWDPERINSEKVLAAINQTMHHQNM